MKLSANFTLSELTKSQTAIRHGIPNEPNADQIDNLKQQVEGLKILIDLYKRQLWEQRLLSSQLESSNNLLQGYKKVIQKLTDKLKQKEL